MELRHLRYFLALAEEGSFTRAAARVGIAQPPLSQQIKDLENEVGAALFRRLPQGAELTDAGRMFLEDAKLAVAIAERAKQSARRAERGEIGRLVLGWTPSAAFNKSVTNTIRRFRARWPEVGLSLEEGTSPRLLEKLIAGEIDAAFIRPGLEDPALVSIRRLADEPLLIALPDVHHLAKQRAIAMADLRHEPFIMFHRSVGLSLYDEALQACRDAGFEMNIVQEAPQLASVLNLVAAGIGVSIVPASFARLDLDGLVFREIDGPVPVARLGLAALKNQQSRVVGNLLSALED